MVIRGQGEAMMKVEKFLNFLTIILVVIYMVYIRFSNAEMTNVELLLYYWKEYLASIIIVAICYYLFKNE